MTVIGPAAADAMARLAALLPTDVSCLGPREFVAFLEATAEVRRQLDAIELVNAGEMTRRSADGPDSLARRLGYRTAADALEAVTGSSGKEARQLVRDSEEIAKLPHVAEAVLAGRIGRESAQAITQTLGRAAHDTDPVEAAGAEQALVELAQAAPADRVREAGAKLAGELSVRAVEDLHKRAMAERYFSVGPVKDGAARVSGLLPAEHAETIRTVIDAYVNPKAKVRFRDPDAPDPDAPDGDAPDGEALDARTAGQKRADVVRDIFAFAARSADVPDMGGDHPTVWLSTTESELAAGRGLAFFAGASEPAPVAVAGQAACTGGVQQVIFTDDGRLLRLGREKRGFTRRQRRAIALRDGGTCLIPDCTAPAQWCEAHHVTSWREGGPTDVDNGVLVCWYHHHEIDSGPWHVRMTRGKPEVRYTAFGKDTGWTPAGDAWVHAAASARDGTRRHRT